MRVSCTTLETFRLYLEPPIYAGDTEVEIVSEEKLLASIKREQTTTPEMKLGLAYEKVIEAPERYQVRGGYLCDGYSFDHATVQPLLELIDRRGLFQVKSIKRIDGHTIVAKADQLVGTEIVELKTTTSSFDIDKYLESAQWRFMAWVFEASRVTYRVAVLDDHGNSVASLKALEAVAVYPYAGLHQECVQLLVRFVEYIRRRNLEPFFAEREPAIAELI